MIDEPVHVEAENPSIDTDVFADPPGSTSLTGELLQRRERRRADLVTVNGLVRENARALRRYLAGSISSREYNAYIRFSYLQLATLRTAHGIEVIERGQQAAGRIVDGGTPAPSLSDYYRSIRIVTAPQAEPAELVNVEQQS